MSGPAKQHGERFLALVDEAKSRIQQMNIDQYKALRESGEKHLLIDIREESEWNAGRAQGSMYLGKGIIERDVEEKIPERSTKMVLYCGGGYRSALAADNLQKMGYTDVISLDGGWRAWNSAGLPVEK